MQLGPDVVLLLNQGKVMVTPPMAAGAWGDSPAILAISPIKDHPQLRFIMRYDPQAYFSQLLTTAQAGESGETYAINLQGQMISQSRFVEDLQAIGLLAADETDTVFKLAVRDPGRDLTTDLNRFRYDPGDEGLTQMAAAVTSRQSGSMSMAIATTAACRLSALGAGCLSLALVLPVK